MKKLVYVLLAFVLALSVCFSLVSCKDNPDSDDNVGAPQNPFEGTDGGRPTPIIPVN